MTNYTIKSNIVTTERTRTKNGVQTQYEVNYAFIEYKVFTARTRSIDKLKQFAITQALNENGKKIDIAVFEYRNGADNTQTAFFTLLDTLTKKRGAGATLDKWKTAKRERANANIVTKTIIDDGVDAFRAKLADEHANAGALLDDLQKTLERLQTKIKQARENQSRIEKLQAMDDAQARDYIKKQADERKADALKRAYIANASKPIFRDIFKAVASANYITPADVRKTFENYTNGKTAGGDKTARAIYNDVLAQARAVMLITD